MDPIDTFVAYRHTGVPETELEGLMQFVKSGMDASGLSWHCTYWQEDNFRASSACRRDIMDHAEATIVRCKFLICVISSPIDSPGMTWEMGFCRGNLTPILSVAMLGTESYGVAMADKVMWWSEYAELESLLSELGRVGYMSVFELDSREVPLSTLQAMPDAAPVAPILSSQQGREAPRTLFDPTAPSVLAGTGYADGHDYDSRFAGLELGSDGQVQVSGMSHSKHLRAPGQNGEPISAPWPPPGEGIGLD